MARKDITDKQVCACAAAFHDHGLPFGLERLQALTGQPYKVCYRAMERALEHGYLECGVSLRSGWPTPKGRELLENQ